MPLDEAPGSYEEFNAAAREWIDWHWRHLDGRIGRRVMETCTVILPITEHFPESISLTRDGAQRVLDRLRDFFHFPGPVELEVFQIDAMTTHGVWESSESGRYVAGSESADGVARVWIEERRLCEGPWLVGCLAQILCREWLGRTRAAVVAPAVDNGSDVNDPEEADGSLEEWALGDLAAVYVGAGVFVANASIQERNWSTAHESGGWVELAGHMTLAMYGHALALFAEDRGEEKPAWANHLRPDVRKEFVASRRYLKSRTEPPPHRSGPPPALPRRRPLLPTFGLETAEESRFGPKMDAETLWGTIENEGRTEFPGVDFCGSVLSGSNLAGCDFRGCGFFEADLQECEFRDADLREADFSEARLDGASFKGADLRDADFCDADLMDVDFSDADVRGADFGGAVLIGATFDRARWDASTEFGDHDPAELADDETVAKNHFSSRRTRAGVSHVDTDPVPVGKGLTIAMFAWFGAMAGLSLAASIAPRSWDAGLTITIAAVLGACGGHAVYWKVMRNVDHS